MGCLIDAILLLVAAAALVLLLLVLLSLMTGVDLIGLPVPPAKGRHADL